MAANNKLDTRSIGLDIGLAFSKFLTGKENLHYGLWATDMAVCAANIGAAQEAYTEKLFGLLPQGKNLRILDIGGGAGETAKKLVALGHQVEIVIPSSFLAQRCRENAGPTAMVHETTFEAFETDNKFDLCLFSESFQYIPTEIALDKSTHLLKEGGAIIISDCFRTEAFYQAKTDQARVGGGHSLAEFRAILAQRALKIIFEEDITTAVAASVDVEQEMFNVFGYAIARTDDGLASAHPFLRRILRGIFDLFVSKRRRARLDQRLNQKSRSAANFCRFNTYLMMKLHPTD
jgi:SAM-dependent methyltransferase